MMQWKRDELRLALEPGAPILLMAMIVSLNRAFRIHTMPAAVLMGIGLAVLLFAVAFILTSRFKQYQATPMLNPWCLPWAGGLGLAGGLLMVLGGEPSKYWGFGLVGIAGVYVIVGGVALIRLSGAPAR